MITVSSPRPDPEGRSDATDQDDGKRSADIEQHKEDTVSKARRGQGEWKPELATTSEQDVRADRDGKSLQELEREGAGKAQEEKKD